MKYKTTHLDEASYFVQKGHKYTSIKVGDLQPKRKFEHSKELEQHRKQFWGGNAVVNLHKWLSLRQQLKHEQQRNLNSSRNNP